MTHFEESVVRGLIWYIQVSLLHQGYFPDDASFECVKTDHPLEPFIYKEAVRLFTMFNQVKNSTDFIVLDSPQLNGYTGQIQTFILQNGQFTVTVKTTQSSSTCFMMQIHPQHMEPLHRVKEFGVLNLNLLGIQQSEEIVSLPNLLYGSDISTPYIKIKMNFKVFELMRKRFVRPEKTPSNLSRNALLIELSKMDHQAMLQDQQKTSELFDYTSERYNLTPFKMPFQIIDKTLFKSGCNLPYFSIDTSSSKNWDDVLHSVYAKEGTIELDMKTFDTLTPGQCIDFQIIDLCLKW
jgi:hypothetical protein